ncbi:MAG: cupin domain-containing protein [Hyphomonadaceae bacterium]
MSQKLDLDAMFVYTGTSYPAPHDGPCRAREAKPLGLAAGLTQFGVNLVRLKPGVWTGQRHWHSDEDEFVWVTEGEVVLATDHGEEIFRAGDCIGFPAGKENAHHFKNQSERDAVLLTVGTRSMQDECRYPDIDLFAKAGRYGNPDVFVHKDGSPYKTQPE